MRILITEDNQQLAEFIQQAILQDGHAADIANSAGEMNSLIDNWQYDALVLDLGLPDTDGIDVIRQLRGADNPIPILILTARGGVEDRIKGLDLGADDYLNKPFAIDELKARLRAILRRPVEYSGNLLTRGNVSLDSKARRVMVDDKNINMGKTEVAILEYMIRHASLTVSKDAIYDAIYALGFEVTDNAIQVAMHRIRKKLEQAGSSTDIKTIRGIGYILS
ncbi:response regulator transcription factor [Pseudoalteromonas luteoviolacea]|uniref:Transcriptional regulator n=1 Tax=Pseudoalteromonas luteoviolacea H33 TaxID=1365251 RepID=A0A162AJC8_9GAMM|nr:response regulator transcription factor [Pseudoalteromonas luteoviolacea]KZN50944.1 transcriptional regulator [Pseudoalteromonas luteoviolacea H33]KZN75018.1 transcriptional regulator [Pseudoalteromonas luteoviolacea H33-S]MBQ4879610.1 response regulator transcription factor [Pseudoalteromonas luteoviolacea]MBQ4909140.1 response regulator transcription factor [Pseudoalteromonas luteoviolacea]MCF6442832.1 response regulator transcription factor [Pseudoalteromonas luteoviolacea]